MVRFKRGRRWQKTHLHPDGQSTSAWHSTDHSWAPNCSTKPWPFTIYSPSFRSHSICHWLTSARCESHLGLLRRLATQAGSHFGPQWGSFLSCWACWCIGVWSVVSWSSPNLSGLSNLRRLRLSGNENCWICLSLSGTCQDGHRLW